MLGENWLIFALDPNLELDAETLVFHSGPKFLCFLVDFYKYFWFWCQTEIVSEKVYAVIWSVLEITSLKFHYKTSTTATTKMNLMQQCKKMIDLRWNFDNSTVNFKRPNALSYSGGNWKVYEYCFMKQKCQL